MPKGRAGDNRPRPESPADESTNRRAQMGLLIAALVVAGLAVIAADFVFGAIFGNGATPTPTPAASASAISTTDLGLVLLLPR